MPQKCGQAHQRHGACVQAIVRAPGLHHRHRKPALEGVEQQREHGGELVARAQHVGGARVFAAVAARVVQAHGAADDDRKGQRPDQVGGHGGQGRKKGGKGGKGGDGFQENSPYVFCQDAAPGTALPGCADPASLLARTVPPLHPAKSGTAPGLCPPNSRAARR